MNICGHEHEGDCAYCEIGRLRMALLNAVQPHAFNCGYMKHPTAIKMIPVGKCTCGVDKLLSQGPAAVEPSAYPRPAAAGSLEELKHGR